MPDSTPDRTPGPGGGDLTGRTLRVALVNDYPLVISGLRTLLVPFRARVGVLELDVREPVHRDVDVVLFDAFGSPGGLGRYLTGPGPPVLVYSFVDEPEAVATALRLGAAGYVSKAVPVETLVGALEDAAAGRRVVASGEHPEVDAPATGCLAPWPGQAAGLGRREAEILALICRGATNQEIAAALYLSLNTIKTYVRSAYHKIDVSTRPQAVLWGVHHGFARVPLRLPPGD